MLQQASPVKTWTASWLASQPTWKRQAILEQLGSEGRERFRTDWWRWARPEQIASHTFPASHTRAGFPWRYWLILAGRGFGKTRTGAEQVRLWSETFERVNLIAATSDDARDIMVEGESGILACSPNFNRPIYRKALRRIDWPSGAHSLIFTADEPERLRGKQHDKLWADELASWRYPEAWDQAQFGLRLGAEPQAIITTTPRPTKIIRELVDDPNTMLTRGTTYDNRANLAPGFFADIIKKYEGTRLGRQELEAALLLDNPDALWQRTLLDKYRVTKFPPLKRIVVGVDPQAGLDGAETGIIVAGVADCPWERNGRVVGVREEAFVLDDLSVRSTPDVWAKMALAGYNKYSADRIVAETNQGGEMVKQTIGTAAAEAKQRVAYKGVHASRGKIVRAEPISALYEQGCVHHIGCFASLEDQMCEWVPGMPSPDRIDALVWTLTDLMLTRRAGQANAW